MAGTEALLPGDLADLAGRFRRFAVRQARPSSPLYANIATGVAEDPDVLRLARQATSSPVTNLLFAAVHDLLLDGADHPLRSFYPNLTACPNPVEQVYPAFHDFCKTYEPELVAILTPRRTQTNEVRRCAWLALGLAIVARRAPRFSMIDVGASAGLHLLWRRFGYNYDGNAAGDPHSAVQLRCELRGAARPGFPDTWPEPVSQVGIDLHPLDVSDPRDQRWLRALVWPEHTERAELLDAALSMAAADPPEVLAGDVFDVLPEHVRQTPSGLPVCICHNFLINQFSDPDRVRFDAMLADLAHHRDIYRLAAEWIGTETPEFTLSLYRHGNKSQRLLAQVDDHGAWIRWAESLD